MSGWKQSVYLYLSGFSKAYKVPEFFLHFKAPEDVQQLFPGISRLDRHCCCHGVLHPHLRKQSGLSHYRLASDVNRSAQSFLTCFQTPVAAVPERVLNSVWTVPSYVCTYLTKLLTG